MSCHVGARNQSSLKEQQVLLKAQPSLPPHVLPSRASLLNCSSAQRRRRRTHKLGVLLIQTEESASEHKAWGFQVGYILFNVTRVTQKELWVCFGLV